MGLVGFLLFSVKYCVNVLAWPLLALAYPLCASIRAIETNSVLDTQKLNSYWVVFSLILLLEHTLSLFEWFPFWPYLRLIIVCFLEYSSVEKEKILAEVEKYVRENGSEALEKTIASKSDGTKNIEVKEIQALSVSSTDNGRVNQPNSKEGDEARKDIKAVEEVIKKNQVKETTQVNRLEPQLTQTKNRIALPTETGEKVSEVQAESELPQTPVSRIVHKKWACALCQVTTQSEAGFISHLSGKQHKSILSEAANAKNQPVFPKVASSYSPKKYDHPAERDPGKNSNDQTVFPKVVFSHIRTTSGQSIDVPQPGMIFNASPNRWEPSLITGEKLQSMENNNVRASSTSKSNQRKQETKPNLSNGEMKQKSVIKQEEKRHGEKAKKQKTGTVEVKDLSLWCRVCNISCTSKVNMKTHLRGKKHLNKVQLLAKK